MADVPIYWKRFRLVAALVISVVVGIALLGFISPTAPIVAIPGVVVALTSSMFAGHRWGLANLGGMVVCAFVATQLNPYPIAAGLFLAALGVLMGMGAMYGLNVAFLYLPLYTGSLMIAPTPAPLTGMTTHIDPQYFTFSESLEAVVPIALGGLWAWLVVFAMSKYFPPPTRTIWSKNVAIFLAIVFGVLLGLTMLLVLLYVRIPVAGWLILTLVILFQPTVTLTYSKTIRRVVGTVAGVVLAALIAAVTANTAVHMVLGVVLMIFALAFLLDKTKYWLYVLLFTPAMVFFSSAGINTLQADFDRLVFTLMGAVIVLVLTLFIDKVANKLQDAAAPTSAMT